VATVRDADAARAAILDAAVDLIAERGMAETSVAMIAEHAGVSKSAVFYHFGNKAGLLETLESHHAAAYANALNAKLDHAEDELEALIFTFRSYFDFLALDPRIVRTMTRLYLEQVPSSEELRRLRTRVTHICERAQARGIMRRDVDPLVIIVTGFSLIEHWFLLRYLFEDPATDRLVTDEDFYQGVLRLLFGGLLGPEAGATQVEIPQKLRTRKKNA
jgi:AcrR family transcriptional regulator